MQSPPAPSDLSPELSPGAADIKAAQILIVDDEPVNVLLLRRVLARAGYTRVSGLTDSRQVEDACLLEPPDLILLDLQMPHLSGYEVMERLQGREDAAILPILVLTADGTPVARKRALSGGAKDFVLKPFDQMEVLLRVKNLLEARFLHLAQRDQNRLLEERVRERTRALEQSKRDLEESQAEMLQRLAQAAEFRDDETGHHTQRVSELAERLSRALGLDEERVALIRRAAPLHDVGKIGIADAILLKPGKLSAEEFEVMKSHAEIGAVMLREGHSALVQVAETIALTHHEWWDGSGYPRGLRGEEIPIEGRILAVVDVFDALTHERPYKEAWAVDEALAEIERQSGRHFDPHVAEAFVRLVRSTLAASDHGPT